MLLLFLLVSISGCGRTLMPTPDIYRPGSAPLFESVAPELQGNQLSVLYVTDRLPEVGKAGSATVYGSERSASAVLGSADVLIKGRTIGIGQRVMTLKPRDDALRI